MKIIDKVHRLDEIRQEMPEALSKAFEEDENAMLFSLIEEHTDIKIDIKKQFLDSPTILIPDDSLREERKTVQKIVLDEKLPLEEDFEGTPLEKAFDAYPLDKIDDDELEKLTEDHFFSWHSQYEYIHGLLEVGALVARIDQVPDEFNSFLQEMRQCYAFQQYLSVCVLCRTTIEIALRHICQVEGFFDPEHENYGITKAHYARKAQSQNRSYRIPEDYEMQPRDLRALLSSDNHFRRFQERIGGLYADLCRVVHGNRTVSGSEALDFARDTLQLVHDLYEV